MKRQIKLPAFCLHNLDLLAEQLEKEGLDWDVGFTGRHREARVWEWPNVVGRSQSEEYVPASKMLVKACDAAGIQFT